MIVIGITGSIGMGKTTLANMMRARGIPVHDSDAAVHRLLGPGGDAVGIIGQIFPEALVTDATGQAMIDRQALGRIIFASRAKKQQLENILHPMVRAQSDAFKSEMKRAGHEMAALDIPLLFETGAEKRVDVTICVSAPNDLQRARVMARPGMTSEKFEKIVSGQMPDAEKRKRADYVVETGESMEDTARQLDEILQKIRDTRGSG